MVDCIKRCGEVQKSQCSEVTMINSHEKFW